jgi:hypothetical protein
MQLTNGDSTPKHIVRQLWDLIPTEVHVLESGTSWEEQKRFMSENWSQQTVKTKRVARALVWAGKRKCNSPASNECHDGKQKCRIKDRLHPLFPLPNKRKSRATFSSSNNKTTSFSGGLTLALHGHTHSPTISATLGDSLQGTCNTYSPKSRPFPTIPRPNPNIPNPSMLSKAHKAQVCTPYS